MCVGEPMRLTFAEGIAGTAIAGNRTEVIDLSLTPDARAGDWVLTFLGTAREVISEDEAAKISAALNGLRRLMQGGAPDALIGAFADLENRSPSLPPHLLAAQQAGQSRG